MHALKSTPKIIAITPCSLLFAGLLACPSWAHPGHGVEGGDGSMLHYLTEPCHLVAALGLPLFVAGIFVWRAFRARRAKQAG